MDVHGKKLARTLFTTATEWNAVPRNKPVGWTSLNPAIATVNATGLVSGVSAGAATIRATVDAVQGSATITVTNIQPVAKRIAIVEYDYNFGSNPRGRIVTLAVDGTDRRVVYEWESDLRTRRTNV